MELADVVNGVEKHEDLWFFVDFLVEGFEDMVDDKLMHVLFLLAHLVVVPDSFQSHPFSHLLLHHFVDVELDHVLGVGLVEVEELLLHRGRTSYHMRT